MIEANRFQTCPDCSVYINMYVPLFLCATWYYTSWPEYYKTVSKNVPLCHCPCLCQILTDFQNTHWHTLWKNCNNMVMKYPTTTATLPCEIYIFKNHNNQNKYICKNYLLKRFFLRIFTLTGRLNYI